MTSYHVICKCWVVHMQQMARDELGLTEGEMEARLERLQTLLPGITERLPAMKPKVNLIASMLQNRWIWVPGVYKARRPPRLRYNTPWPALMIYVHWTVKPLWVLP